MQYQSQRSLVAVHKSGIREKALLVAMGTGEENVTLFIAYCEPETGNKIFPSSSLPSSQKRTTLTYREDSRKDGKGNARGKEKEGTKLLLRFLLKPGTSLHEGSGENFVRIGILLESQRSHAIETLVKVG